MHCGNVLQTQTWKSGALQIVTEATRTMAMLSTIGLSASMSKGALLVLALVRAVQLVRPADTTH